MVATVAQALHRRKRELILVIPPFSESFGPADFENLSPIVDYFSLNSYDFSSAQKPGPNSPQPWVKSVVEAIRPHPERAGQILMGLNFYGNRYDSHGAEPVLGSTYVRLLQQHRKSIKMTWDAWSREHHIQYSDGSMQHSLYYPTRRSIRERLALAKSMG